MSDEDDLAQKARAGFEDLCRALNMDEEAASEAWKTYENIRRNFTLEVNINCCGGGSWLRCQPRTVARPGGRCPPAATRTVTPASCGNMTFKLAGLYFYVILLRLGDRIIAVVVNVLLF